jgi:hypothetical protein
MTGIDADVVCCAEERERLHLDAKAREKMQLHMERVQAQTSATAVVTTSASASGSSGDGDGTATAVVDRAPWKWAVRKRIWDMLEDTNLAAAPRPVHHRIPNFVSAEQAALTLAATPAFRAARVVKVNPDTPQKAVRFGVLHGGKRLMVPQPRLRTGFFSILDPQTIMRGGGDGDCGGGGMRELRFACTSQGAAKVAAGTATHHSLAHLSCTLVAVSAAHVWTLHTSASTDCNLIRSRDPSTLAVAAWASWQPTTHAST